MSDADERTHRRVTRSVLLPLSEIELRASRSSGPGGQHANTSETRVEAIFEVGPKGLGLSKPWRQREARGDLLSPVA